MSTITVECACGWSVMSNDRDAVTVATRNHDAKCPALFRPDKIIDDTHADLGAAADHVPPKVGGYPAGGVVAMTVRFPTPCPECGRTSHDLPPADFDG